MIKKWLSYLFIALIVLQSAGTMATDDHQSHQDGIQHLEFDHGHESKSPNKKISIKKSNSYDSVDFDCHHCCHCHGTHLNYLPITAPNFLVSAKSLILNGYNITAPSGLTTSLFRPPKI